MNGWPVFRKHSQPEIIDFWNYREELAVFDGLIMKGEKIVILRSMRSSLLELVHAGHMGVEKTLKRARGLMFWPKISNDNPACT